MTTTLDATSEDKLLGQVIAAIGKCDASDAVRARFENWFRALKRDVLARLPGFEAEVELRTLLRKLQVNAEERQELREQLAPFKAELARIRHIKLAGFDVPKDQHFLLRALTDPDIISAAERAEATDIGILLELSDDYRKGPIRKLILEPFLVMLKSEGVEATRRLPLTEMVDALLGYLGINLRRHPRPSKSGLRTIVQEVKRDFERRPPQRLQS